ncbi:GNAT family N-acetyltransferase [Pseudomonas sp. ZM23]|uniref:GNAT family N-acetyltransferase n=1 Tax=Pseudomonas triclosanedens TaxID=2961893 RepID=A0ABY6ZVD7_9PSED|nr:GNAT family N-acetyltransferase [Pseudomonas triclosanedens]MCP8465334.1 GNAT family N-acetyltransferase [Pseudomonas triclosanedens]MCP8470726.1 GNAT family N-acetyltransferase [Pseudomonas triclosanedens]MCP8476633.1 GNAT family N-acetyltransferase [Pseudomonas triclosanedens]WAI48912.1 GNAT family N-acetyltransferase [Pseudomonas triclosanedens]
MEHPALDHRPALASDLDEVVLFAQDRDELFYCYPKASWPLTVAQLAAAIAERRGSTLATLEGRPAGFANFYQWQLNEHCALGNMMVAPWARRHGVAQYLIDVMEKLARDQYKARLMKVSCFNANAAGLLLYTRLGYRPQAIVERIDPQGRRVALIQLEKTLEHA